MDKEALINELADLEFEVNSSWLPTALFFVKNARIAEIRQQLEEMDKVYSECGR